jgi:probable HAF family extracellular repeat protein
MLKFVVTVAVAALAATSVGAAARYEFTDLGVLPGYERSQAVDINNTGQIIGGMANHSTYTFDSFIWTKEAGLSLIADPLGQSLSVRGINDAGQIVGRVSGSDFLSHPFILTPGSNLNISPLHGEGAAINNLGQIAGNFMGYFFESESAQFEFGSRAFRFGPPFVNIGDLPGGLIDGYATAINDLGEVVGEGRTGSARHAFLWTEDTGFQDLGFLPGGSDYSVASDVNSAGQVVGRGSSADHVRPFLWTAIGGMQDLGTLFGGAYGSAAAINEAGYAVGYSVDGEGDDRAVLWAPDANGPIDLNLLADTGPWKLRSASAINDLGQIVGYMGYGGDEMEHAFLLTPIASVPEPSSWALLIAGFGLVGGSLRMHDRRRRSSSGRRHTRSA